MTKSRNHKGKILEKLNYIKKLKISIENLVFKYDKLLGSY